MTNLQLKKETKAFIKHVKDHADLGNKLVFWIDLFCGAGGTSTGIHFTDIKDMFVAACVNHDKNAILSHAENHPNTLHFTEDIRDFEVVKKLKYLIDQLRISYPNCTVNIWASLECTNFSKAKGGQSRNADSRTLAEHMFMYLEELDPDYFWVENVREFMSLGPLDDNGKPVSRTAGKDYANWIEKVKSYGFSFDAKLLNSANYGAYQSRERLFIQFAKYDLPVKWPEQTHTKDKTESQLFPMEKWKPVREVLDLDDEGVSIFERKKSLVDNTLNVIMKGITKALKENENVILFKYYGNGDNLNSINSPAGTLTTKDRFAKIQIIFNQYKNGNTSSIENPLGTITTIPKSNLVSFIMNPSHGGHTTSINKPSPVIIARQDKAPLYLIRAFMNEHGIFDIKMRMLNIPELKQIQGFPKDYKLIGNQTEQKKFIGNAVEVNQAKALVQNNYYSLAAHFNKIAS